MGNHKSKIAGEGARRPASGRRSPVA